jgi:putative transposase
LEIWAVLLERSVQKVNHQVGLRYHVHGRPVYRIDGSTLSMPDEPELVEAFGYADTKHGPSRFPVSRITFITQAGAETVVDYRIDPYRTGEDAQFHAMWNTLSKGAICLADRHFSSFYDMAKLQQRQIDVVSQLHQRRCPDRLIRHGKKIGKQEWIVPLKLAPQLRKKYNDPTLPEVLLVRLILVHFCRNGKPRKLWLITTLMDTQRYRRSDIIKLYRDRWGIETRIGSLKTTLELAVLRSKKLLSLRCELAASILAHNLTWTIIHQAARQTRTPADRISFAGTLKIILTFSPALRTAGPAQRPMIYRRMLEYVAQQKNPYRPNRIEPRLIKRQTKRYGFLKVSRAEARKNA